MMDDKSEDKSSHLQDHIQIHQVQKKESCESVSEISGENVVGNDVDGYDYNV